MPEPHPDGRRRTPVLQLQSLDSSSEVILVLYEKEKVTLPLNHPSIDIT
jgi:hypothetical protein